MQTINMLDQKIYAQFAQYLLHHLEFLKLAKFLAVWPVYVVPAALVIFWFYGPREKLVSIRVTLAGLFGWLVVNSVIGHFFFRPRPAAPLASDFLFNRPDKSFPSDHATLGFALFLGLWMAGYRKLAIFFAIITVVFSVFRVATGLHFASDIAGGVAVGLLVAWLAHWQRKFIDRYIGEPLVKIAKVLKLA